MNEDLILNLFDDLYWNYYEVGNFILIFLIIFFFCCRRKKNFIYVLFVFIGLVFLRKILRIKKKY